MRKYLAEMLGTMVLVLMGCGAAVFFGCGRLPRYWRSLLHSVCRLLGMAYAIGGISGCHIQSCDYAGCMAFEANEQQGLYPMYILSGDRCADRFGDSLCADFDRSLRCVDFNRANAFGEGRCCELLSLRHGLHICFSCWSYWGLPMKKRCRSLRWPGHWLDTYVGTYRMYPDYRNFGQSGSLGAPAIFAGGEALSQLWLFVVAPFVGAALSAGVWRMLTCPCEEK